jgi:hypothetical protein
MTASPSPKGNKMTYSTDNFQAGSEFRVQWTTAAPNPSYNPKMAMMQGSRYRKYAEILTNHVSEIFSTYEEAESFSLSVGCNSWNVMVRLPGNKNFRTAYDTKKI